MTTIDPLIEQIMQALHRVEPDAAPCNRRRAAAILPLIAAERRKAQADAWEEGYGDCWTYHQSEGMKGTEDNPYREKED